MGTYVHDDVVRISSVKNKILMTFVIKFHVHYLVTEPCTHGTLTVALFQHIHALNMDSDQLRH
jgi:hypothetical protein